MTRVAIDTNVLVYAEIEPQTQKGSAARNVILKTSRDGVLPMQVLGEFLRVVQRLDAALLDQARAQIESYLKFFTAPLTTADTLYDAVDLARAHGLQSWDAVIVAASAAAGAKVLLSEDMQDGRAIGGVRILNPFNPANDAVIAALF